MRYSYSQSLRYLLIGLLVVFLFWRGIIPAFTHIDSDFPNYYTSSKLVVDGGDLTKLYDDQWFQDQIHSYGMNQQGKFSPFPPATALILVPLTGLDPLDALRITVVINLALLALSIRFLSALFAASMTEAVTFTLLSGMGLANCFRLGQLYILVSFLIIAGYYAYTRKKKVLAGISLGVFLPIKYYPIVILAYFAFKREWRIVIAGSLSSLLVVLAGILVLGWDVHKVYFSSVLGGHLSSHFTHQNPFSSAFQSWDSLFRRLLVFDPDLNPHPLFRATELFLAGKISVLLILVVAGVGAMIRVYRRDPADRDVFSIGLIGVMTLLLAPGTATYHYVLLWLPVGLLYSYFSWKGRNRIALAIVGLYAVLGFIPYGATRQFDGQGALTLLAYPRLGLLLAMFLLTLWGVWNRKTAEIVQE